MNNTEPISMYVFSGTETLISPRPSGSQMEILEISLGEVSVQIGTESLTMRRGDILYVPTETMLRATSIGGYAFAGCSNFFGLFGGQSHGLLQ